jgi:hypothetical protein
MLKYMDPQNQQPQPPYQATSNQPKTPPDPKMVESLLALTRAQMEQETTRKEEQKAMEHHSYIEKFFQMFNPAYLSESPQLRRRLIIFLVVTVGSTIISLIIGF